MGGGGAADVGAPPPIIFRLEHPALRWIHLQIEGMLQNQKRRTTFACSV